MRWSIALFLSALYGCSAPVCPPETETGEMGRVVRVNTGDTLALNTGQVVRLVSISAPPFRRDAIDDNEAAKRSRRHLSDLSLGRDVQLCYPGLTRDRYDRALAHLFTADQRGPQIWLNHEMLEVGHAWYRFYPDTLALVEPLQNAERSARYNTSGVWKTYKNQYIAGPAPPDSAYGFHIAMVELGPRVKASPSTVTDRRFRAKCVRRLRHTNLNLAIHVAAADVCDLPSGEYLVRGRVSDGALQLRLNAHIEPFNRQ